MKLIKQSFEILEQQKGLEGIYKQIELAGRTCYKSEDKITNTSAKEFVDRLIKSEHCYDGDTEVLTSAGWIKWRYYNNEKLAVINTDLSFKGFEVPERVIRHSYTGKFYNYPILGITVTDGHRMFGVCRNSKNDFYNNSNYDFITCNEEYLDNNKRKKTLGERMFKTPRCCRSISEYNPIKELVGFWLGDGCYNPKIKNKLVFHLKKERKISYLKHLCDDLGFTLEIGKSNYYRVCYPNLGTTFNEKFYNEDEKHIDKYYDSPGYIKSVIIGLLNSDGSKGINTNTYTFTTTSKSIKCWLERCAPLAGYSISIKEINNNNPMHSKVYKILFHTTNYTIVNDSRNIVTKCNIFESTKDVYCATVSTGLLLVRGTNGITTICGNCAMLEHGTVYLAIPMTTYAPEAVNIYCFNNYSVVNDCNDFIFTDKYGDKVAAWCVTTNLRVLIENNCLEDLEFLCEPTKYHTKRYTVKCTTNRQVTHELVRHRKFSFGQESSRYCNYSLGKFNNELTFIEPCWLKDSASKVIYQNFLEHTEHTYMMLKENGWSTQACANILLNATKSDIVITGSVDDWCYLFNLRVKGTTGTPHPQMLELMTPVYQEFIKRGYING